MPTKGSRTTTGPKNPPPVGRVRRAALRDFAIIVAAFIVSFLVLETCFKWVLPKKDVAWSISEIQRHQMAYDALHAKGRARFTVTVVPGAPREALIVAYAIMQEFNRGGWEVRVAPFTAYHDPGERGLRLGVSSACARRKDECPILDALVYIRAALPFEAAIVENVTLKDDEIMLAVGWRP